MKVYISVDIEGVAGVVHAQQGTPGNAEYERARRLMTAEANAAIEGAFAGGATEVLVNDSHGPMTNLIPELLDPRAEVILGKPKPMNMCAGLSADHNAMFLIGYHTAASRQGVLAHTINGFAFREIRLNGIACSEATLNGAYAGSLGVPVVLLSGDDLTARECGTHFPGARLVVTKHAIGAQAARAIAPSLSCERIRDAATAALRDTTLREGANVAAFTIEGPYALEVSFNKPVMADLAAIVPVAERRDPTTVALHAETMGDVLGWVNTLSALTAFLR